MSPLQDMSGWRLYDAVGRVIVPRVNVGAARDLRRVFLGIVVTVTFSYGDSLLDRDGRRSCGSGCAG
jgi:hypothetical protein